MAKAKEELATVNTSALQVSGLLAEQLADLQTDGFENVTAEDAALPIFTVLQSISPQCDKKNEAYDPDLSEGFFFNNVSGKDQEVLDVIPIGFSKAYIEWGQRGTPNAGYKGKHAAGSPVLSSAVAVGNKLILPNGNELSETAEHMIMVIPPDGGSPYVALLPLSSTQLKHSKRFVSEMTNKTIEINGQLKRAPMFAQRYRLKTGVESNTKGSWYGLTSIEYVGFTPDEYIQQAKTAAEAFNKYAAKAEASYEKANPTASDSVVDAVTESMA